MVYKIVIGDERFLEYYLIRIGRKAMYVVERVFDHSSSCLRMSAVLLCSPIAYLRS